MFDRVKRVWPYLASLGGAVVMILAFFIPSIQDQWDRYQSRKVIERYEALGDVFYEDEKYEMAEEAFTKAFELSESKRLDIEVKRLRARINRIGSDPLWMGKMPDGLREIDFEYVLHLDKRLDSKKHRINALNCYGIFKSGQGDFEEAEDIFNEAIKTDSTDATTYVNRGTLFLQQEKYGLAKKNYQFAIKLDSANQRAHYNLGLVLAEEQQYDRAKAEFKKALSLDPEDNDAKKELDLILEKLKAKVN